MLNQPIALISTDLLGENYSFFLCWYQSGRGFHTGTVKETWVIADYQIKHRARPRLHLQSSFLRSFCVYIHTEDTYICVDAWAKQGSKGAEFTFDNR